MLDLGAKAKQCSAMVVSDCGNTAKLARLLYRLRTGEEGGHNKTATEEMQALIDKLSVLKKRVPAYTPTPELSTVVCLLSPPNL